MYNIEVTDTFGGEANYCWVKRGSTKATSRRGIIKAVKELADWVCRVKVVYQAGDFWEIRPVDNSGVCQVAFVTWADD